MNNKITGLAEMFRNWESVPYDRRESMNEITDCALFNTQAKYQATVINSLAATIHEQNKKWWTNLHTGEPLDRNVGEMLCLVHSEISEAMEGHRKNLKDDHLPERPMIEVELADAVIRIFDIAAGLNLDLGGAFAEKLAYNRVRADHKKEARLAPGGKAY